MFNGEKYLAQSLDSLLAQSFTDFELIISDNASTDTTASICQEYAASDTRIRYVRQPRNIGAAPNHNYVLQQARGDLFKWVGYDDLYDENLLLRCVTLLDQDPGVVLAHSYHDVIDEHGHVVARPVYAMDTSSESPATRLRGVLDGQGGNDIYGVIRREVLRRAHPHASYHNADRTLEAELALHGRFAQWPEALYHRRDHPGRSIRAQPSTKQRSTFYDPSRARQSNAQLYAEYLMGFVAAIRSAPLSSRDRTAAYMALADYYGKRLRSVLLSQRRP